MSTSNYVSSGLSGAASGAAIGTSIMPGWGTAIGGILGGAAGLIGNALGESEEEAEQKKIKEQLAQQYAQGQITLSEYKTALEAAQADYKNALNSTDWEAASKIDFDADSYNRDDYRKSNEASIIEAAKNNMRGENMGQGNSWGSGATGNILNTVVEQQEKLDEYADTQMKDQRDFDYKVASDATTNRLTALKNQLDSLGKSTELSTNALDSYYGGLLSLQNANNTNANNLSLYSMQNNANSTAANTQLLGQGLQALGSSYAASKA